MSSFKVGFTVILLYLVHLSLEFDNSIENSINAIQRAILYYKHNYMFMNLDGIYGLRLLEGQLSSILDSLHGGNVVAGLEADVLTRLETLYVDATTTIDKSLRHVRESDPAYFEQMGSVVESPVPMETHFKMVDPGVRWDKSVLKHGGFDEAFSDKCMAELMGKQPSVARCLPSAECLSSMFERGHQEYTITHQLLYTVLAKQFGCEEQLNAHLERHSGGDTVEDIQLEFCTNNLFEVVEMVQELPDDKLIPPIYRDLFMEQQLVCPMLGFMQFLHSAWLQQIISWQLPSGCYGSHAYPGGTHSQLVARAPDEPVDPGGQVGADNGIASRQPNAVKFVHNSQDVVMQGGEDNKLVFKSSNKSGGQAEFENEHHHFGRKLLEERLLPDGCSAHETAVAAGALSQYLKSALTLYPTGYRKLVSLSGPNYLLAETWQKLGEGRKQYDQDLLGGRDDGREKVNMRNPHLEVNEQVYQDKMNVVGDFENRKPADYANRYEDDDEGEDDNNDDNNDTHDYYDESDGDKIDRGKANAARFLPKDAASREKHIFRFDNENKEDNDVYNDNDEESEDYYRYSDDGDYRNPGNDQPNGNFREAPSPKFKPLLRKNEKLPQAKPFPPIERNEDDDPGYSYDEALVNDAKIVQELDRQLQNVPQISKTTRHSVIKRELETSDKVNLKSLQNENTKLESLQKKESISLGTSYFIVVTAMFVLVGFMFKFIRAKRIIIRYKYG